MATVLKNDWNSTFTTDHSWAAYPPAPFWSTDCLPQLEETFSKPITAHAPLALYINCPPSRAEGDAYSSHILKELELYQSRPAIIGRPFHSVCIDDATQSQLSHAHLRGLLEGLKTYEYWDYGIDCSIIGTPNRLSLERLALLKANGVNRISLDFFSLTPATLDFQNRGFSANDCLACFQRAREVGFQQIQINLKAGMPCETETSWNKTIQQVLTLSPDCISIRQMVPEPHVQPFFLIPELPDISHRHAWVKQAFSALKESGYHLAAAHLAVKAPCKSHCSTPLKHLAQGHDQLSLGAAACGYLQGIHYQNTADTKFYMDCLHEQRLAWERAHQLSPAELVRRETRLQLRTGLLDLVHFQRRYKVNLLEEFEDTFHTMEIHGLLTADQDKVRLTLEGMVELEDWLPLFSLPQHQLASHH